MRSPPWPFAFVSMQKTTKRIMATARRLGTAPHVPGDGQFWEVIWDGMKKKKAQTFHKDFIEIVRDGDN